MTVSITITITATLVCDTRRGPGCLLDLNLGSGRDPTAVAARPREAEDLGRTRARWTSARAAPPALLRRRAPLPSQETARPPGGGSQRGGSPRGIYY
jgi:hypothetical protein